MKGLLLLLFVGKWSSFFRQTRRESYVKSKSWSLSTYTDGALRQNNRSSNSKSKTVYGIHSDRFISWHAKVGTVSSFQYLHATMGKRNVNFQINLKRAADSYIPAVGSLFCIRTSPFSRFPNFSLSFTLSLQFLLNLRWLVLFKEEPVFYYLTCFRSTGVILKTRFVTTLW